jgi:hypothetical protein
MMTVVVQGPTGAGVSDGSHRLLGNSSGVHEELGYRASSGPTGYKVMAVDPTRIGNAQRPNATRPSLSNDQASNDQERNHAS